ncbi:hypothetical protein APHAL10511_003723 [Amanita phalloides]|nr:hypothetical protein APHAL10511_003723 [Amanita phalloides]
MKLPTLVFTTLAALASLSTAFPHDISSLSARHHRLARRALSAHAEVGDVNKRCHKRNDSTRGHHALRASTGLIHVKSSSHCGESGATEHITATSGPNGNIGWLTCGVNKNGWTPPYVRVQDLVVRELWGAIAEQNSVFKPCAPYVSLFEKYGDMYGIHPILLASFGMQESTCNRHAVGGGGEQGIMQISKDKCHGAPGDNCQDPDFNIHTAAKFFSQLLNNFGGNVLLAIGSYNGWFKGMTVHDATAAASSPCCLCQQNLDYLHQFVNGWLQSVDAHDHTPPLGLYFNLNRCVKAG